MLIIRIIEKLLIIYFSLYLLIDVYLYLSALRLFALPRKKKDVQGSDAGKLSSSVSIVVPAFNEEVSIVLCIKMLLDLDYDNYTVLVVNDGSTDSTREKMMSSFEWENFTILSEEIHPITTAPVRNIYVAEGGKLLFIDKENGGKADAINSAIKIAEGEYVCTIDADSILDREALQRVIQPMEDDPSVFVSGGQLALSNDLTLVNNKVVSARMPRNIWVHWQILEYISTFMVARMSLSRINALLIMSGAFSVFRKNDLMEVGGFLTKKNEDPYIIRTLGKGRHTITEDMEVVLRLWKYYRDKKRAARAVFLPGPVCWTEAPESPSALYKQRMRWHQGLAESLWLYRSMMFEPRYRTTGMVALPYYFFMELISPVIKLFALFFIIYLVRFGLVNQMWVFWMMAVTILIATIIMSSITLMIESWSMRQSATNRDALRYKTFGDWLVLLLSGVLGNFSFTFFRSLAQLHGIINFFRKRQEWHKIERKGIADGH